ncbi:MAG: hypothetical protein RSC98_00860 [Clostridia bacterium]
MKRRSVLCIALTALLMVFSSVSIAQKGQAQPPSEEEVRNFLVDCYQWADEGVRQVSIELTYDKEHNLWLVLATGNKALLWKNKDTIFDPYYMDETETSYIAHSVYDDTGLFWSVRTADECMERKSKRPSSHYRAEDYQALAAAELQNQFSLSIKEIDSLVAVSGDAYVDENKLMHPFGGNEQWVAQQSSQSSFSNL